MDLLFIDTASVEGAHSKSLGDSSGVTQFNHLNNVMSGTGYRGPGTLVPTMVNRGTWQRTFTDKKTFSDASKHFFLSESETGDT